MPFRLADLGIGPGLLLDIDGRDDHRVVALAGNADALLTTVGNEARDDDAAERKSMCVDAPA